jgi:hypothetical protein
MFIGKLLKTKFAPPERLTKKFVLAQHDEILKDKTLACFMIFLPIL